METDIILISDTEETNNRDGYQQSKVEVIEIPDDSDELSLKENPECIVSSNEPIDLTVNKSMFSGKDKQLPHQNGYPIITNSKVIIKQNNNCRPTGFQYPRTFAQNPTKSTHPEPEIWSRVLNNCNTIQAHNNEPFFNEPNQSYRNFYNKKSNLPYSHVGSSYNNISRNSVLTIPMKKQNVLKTAKSLFSKRTRTLYHWMYPNSTAQQIKEAVSRTWESMSYQEKNIYVSQVLARPGSSTTNLMVNPQLGQIQALQPQTRCSINQFNPKSTELQNAISSISNETNEFTSSSSISAEPEMMNHMTNKPSHYLTSTNQEFDDDPELNKELIQFSLTFKN